MENSKAYKLGQIFGNLIFAICIGLVFGFAIVYWKATLIVLIILIALFALMSDHKEFKNK